VPAKQYIWHKHSPVFGVYKKQFLKMAARNQRRTTGQQGEQRKTTGQQGGDDLKDRLTKVEASIASMYTKNSIEQLVKEAVEKETAKVRMEVQQQLAAAMVSSGAANQPTGQTAGYKNVKELAADPRLPHLVLW
jgi:hypothetical protein